jgi:hypothetical protein
LEMAKVRCFDDFVSASYPSDGKCTSASLYIDYSPR